MARSTNSGQAAQNQDPSVDISSPYTPRRPSPIVTISINHPIGTTLRNIKNFFTHKQTLFSTTLNIKVNPLVALLSIFGIAAIFGGGLTTAYTFGKTVEQRLLSSIPTPTPTTNPSPPVTTISMAGVVKATTQLPPDPHLSPLPASQGEENQGKLIISSIPTTTIDSPSASDSPTVIPPTPSPTPQQILHYILVSRNVTFLAASSKVNLQKYLNIHVIITGTFNQSTNTLTVAKPQDIEIVQ